MCRNLGGIFIRTGMSFRALATAGIALVGMTGCGASTVHSVATTTHPVRAKNPLFNAASTTTTPAPASPTSTAPVVGDCATVANQYVHAPTLSSPVATLIASACSPAQLQTLVANADPAALVGNAQAISYAVNGVTGEICPENPHTKLCP